MHPYLPECMWPAVAGLEKKEGREFALREVIEPSSNRCNVALVDTDVTLIEPTAEGHLALNPTFGRTQIMPYTIRPKPDLYRHLMSAKISPTSCCGYNLLESMNNRINLTYAEQADVWYAFVQGLISKDVVPALCVATTYQRRWMARGQLLGTWRNAIHDTVLSAHMFFPEKVQDYCTDVTRFSEYKVFPDFKSLYGQNHPYFERA